jgi:hypothetical protein
VTTRKEVPTFRTKADTVSASKPTRKFDPRTHLTPDEEKDVREFVEKGRTIEKSYEELLALAVKVKAIFARKTPGIPVLFDGEFYMTFDSFIDANFPVCARQVRRWLAKAGLTNTLFANHPHPEPVPLAEPIQMPQPVAAPPPQPRPARAEKPAPKPTLADWRKRKFHPGGKFRLKYFQEAAEYFWDRHCYSFAGTAFNKALEKIGDPKHTDDLRTLAAVLRAAAEDLKMLAEAVEPDE